MLYTYIINMRIYTHTCWIHFDAIIKTSEDFFKKYTSHFIWKVVCERELETEQRLQHIDLPSPPVIAVCRSRSPGLLNPGPGVPAALGHVLIPASSRQLVWSPNHWLLVFTELYNSSIAHSIIGMACLIDIKRK